MPYRAQVRKERDEVSKGTIYGFAAYLLWGAFPLYFHQLLPAGAWEILVHRILWTLVVCVVGVVALRRTAFIRKLIRDKRRFALVAIASLLIATNWLVYVFAVNTGRTSQASLGYFLNPLVTIALGVIVLRERLRPLQWIAVGIGAIACVYLTIEGGTFPWISMVLAGSFASYGLAKKRLGGSLTAFESLASETAILAPIALVALFILAGRGDTTFGSEGVGHSLWLASSGIATAIPLLLFAAAAARVPLVTIGLLQFITPVLQLLCAVLFLDEHLPAARWVGFGIVWVALIVLSIDSIASGSRSRRLARAATASTGG
ncbi:EamA family transporter RarD [Yimella sp. cx-51]|nr:EamA family transporter RarD [Yimella sp. cx-51]QTH38591.1 EamA family transporter RarD [Yimella sp. cx-51]